MRTEIDMEWMAKTREASGNMVITIPKNVREYGNIEVGRVYKFKIYKKVEGIE